MSEFYIDEDIISLLKIIVIYQSALTINFFMKI